MSSIDLETLRSDMAFLDDWQDKYRYLIDLGKKLAPLSHEERSPANKVQGCVSQVWLVWDVVTVPESKETRFFFRGDSDALIVRGLIAIALTIFSEKTAHEIISTDALKIFSEFGLDSHLTPQRSNGFASIIHRIIQEAKKVDQAGLAERPR